MKMIEGSSRNLVNTPEMIRHLDEMLGIKNKLKILILE